MRGPLKVGGRAYGTYDGPLAYDDPISLAVAGLMRAEVPRGVTLTSFEVEWRYSRIVEGAWRFNLTVLNAVGSWAQSGGDPYPGVEATITGP